MTTTVISTNTTTSGDTLDLTATQNVLVLSTGSLISTGAVGLSVPATATGNDITIDGFVYGDKFGIETLSGGDKANIQVNGEVSSDGTAIALNGSDAGLAIGANGMVDGVTAGVSIGSGGDHITNDGTITSDNGVGLSIGSVTTIEITNSGTIDGIQSGSIDMLLINYGSITGGVSLAPLADSSVNVVRNYGSIGDGVFLHNGDQLFNSGTIDGNVGLGGNSLIKNSGTIYGDLNMEGSGDQLITNKGYIYGDINLVSGTNSFDSSHGHVIGAITGGSGNDTLIAGSDDDNVLGGAGNDLLKGGSGDDVLNGGTGQDNINGGAGDDTLTGGANHDVFLFSGNFGQDTITDFVGGTASGHDVIRFAHSDFTDFTDLSPHMTQVGADVHIVLDATDSIVLHNVTLGSLSSADFLFG